MNKVSIALSLALAVTGLAACGEKSEPTTITQSAEPFDLALDFYVNPDHAGLYMAIERGYFKVAGLDVKPQVPSDPAAPIKEVAAGRADLAISYEPEVLLARDQGLDVKAVAAVVNQPLTSLISLPAAAVSGPADLAGKTVATAGIPYQEDYLGAILAKAGLSLDDVNVTSVGLNLLPALLGGKAQAILGGFQNIEGVQLQLQGASPSVVNVKDLGVPTYDELVLVANGDRLDEDSDQIRLFIEGLEKGTRDAVADPAAATQAVLSAGDGLDPALTRAEVDATLPLLLPQTTQPYGYMDPGQWEAFAGFLAANGSLDDASTDGALSNDLLPPAPSS
ncbi:MAG: ABC transporter substrate-binding protein [Solirubrobacterales bacterium]